MMKNCNRLTIIQKEKRKYKEFKIKHLKDFKDIIPFFVLSGIRNPIKDYDTNALAESFFENDKGNVFDELLELAEYLSNEHCGSDTVMQMLYGGWNDFSEYEQFSEHCLSEDFKDINREHNPKTLHVLRCIIAGREHKDWHKETYRTFKELLPGYDIELFVKVFGITSPMSHLHSNMVFALQAYDHIKQGKSIDRLKLIPNVRVMLKDLQKGVFDKTPMDQSRRKVQSHIASMLGEPMKVAVDSRMLKAYGVGREYEWNGKLYCRQPTKKLYDFIENHIRILGKTTGYEAREITAMIWAGIRILEGRFKEASTREVLQKILC